MRKPEEVVMTKVSVRIDISAGEADAEALEFATGYLREELLCLDVSSVEVPRDVRPPADGKSGAEIAVLGTLLLTAPDSALLPAVVEVMKSWLGRASGRTARLEIDGDVLDMKGLSSSQQESLIEQWMARHNVPEK
jgi:hypothetical protein